MSSNVTPIRPETEEKPRKPRRKRQAPPANTFDMPSNSRLMSALEGVCASLERLEDYEDNDADANHGLAAAAAILSRMLRESLTNQSLI
ncbi:MAG TPA: hypothetical protein VGL55_16495 [Steroidobacteraceae bacterium]